MERRPAPTSDTRGIEFEEQLLDDVALSPLRDVVGGRAREARQKQRP